MLTRRNALNKDARKGPARFHQPGQSAFKAILPDSHPEDPVYTVISAIFYIGLGDRFDAEKLKAYPPGSVIILPGNTSHFHCAKSGEYMTQVTAIGPLGLEYLNAKDDLRNQSSKMR